MSRVARIVLGDALLGGATQDSLGNAAFGTRGRSGGAHSPYGLVALVEAGPHRVLGLDLRPVRAFLDTLYDTAVPAIPAMRGSGLDETRTLGV